MSAKRNTKWLSVDVHDGIIEILHSLWTTSTSMVKVKIFFYENSDGEYDYVV